MKPATDWRATRIWIKDAFIGKAAMKLSLFFMIFDVLILLAYPVAYVIHRLRRLKGVK